MRMIKIADGQKCAPGTQGSLQSAGGARGLTAGGVDRNSTGVSSLHRALGTQVARTMVRHAERSHEHDDI
jgi:hypothetical protein